MKQDGVFKKHPVDVFSDWAAGALVNFSLDI